MPLPACVARRLAPIFFALVAACGPVTDEEATQDTALTAPALTFFNGFETGLTSSTGNLRTHLVGGTFETVASPVAAGTRAGKLDLRFDSVAADNYRAEVQVNENKGDFEFGKEYWFSFKYRFEDWAADRSAEIAPFQVHLRPGSWDPACRTGSAWSNAPFYMATYGDTQVFNYYQGRNLFTAPLQRQRWYTITAHFVVSYNNDGYVEAWLDGKHMGKYVGKLQAQFDNCGLAMRAPYMNFGVYKWDWRTGRPATESSRRTILLDELRIATGSNAYALVTGSTTSAPAPDAGTGPIAEAGLVAHYRFSEGAGTTVGDSSGSGNRATLVNGARFSNGALQLDGRGAYAEAAASPSLNLAGNQLTVASWVNFQDTGAHQIFVGKPASASAHVFPHFSYSLHGVYLSATALTPRFLLTLNGTRRMVASSVPINPGWHHLAGVYDGANLRLYVDGLPRGTLAASGSITSFPTPLRLGTNGGLSEWMKGGLDEVRVYNRALSASEVATLAR